MIIDVVKNGEMRLKESHTGQRGRVLSVTYKLASPLFSLVQYQR